MDYDDFIIVGYRGGWGGDMFASLIYKHFYKDYQHKLQQPKSHVVVNSMIDFRQQHELRMFKNIDDCLFVVDALLQDLKSLDKSAALSKHESAMKKISPFCEFVFDEDPQILANNIKDVLREVYHFKRTKVWPIHYTTRPPKTFSQFSMDWVFPGSKKFRLVCEPRFCDMFVALYLYKGGFNFYGKETWNSRGQHKNKSAFHEDWLHKPPSWYEFDKLEDFVDIDVGKLFIETRSNIDEVEDQLSTTLNTKIELDRDYLENSYRPKTKAILETVFGSNYLENDKDTNFKNLIEYGYRRAKSNF